MLQMALRVAIRLNTIPIETQRKALAPLELHYYKLRASPRHAHGRARGTWVATWRQPFGPFFLCLRTSLLYTPRTTHHERHLSQLGSTLCEECRDAVGGPPPFKCSSTVLPARRSPTKTYGVSPPPNLVMPYRRASLSAAAGPREPYAYWAGSTLRATSSLSTGVKIRHCAASSSAETKSARARGTGRATP